MTVRDASESPAADFRGLLLALRGRAGLGQRELAALLGITERAIRTWEAGDSYPGADRLKALIALYLRRGVFAPGREREEALALWTAAREQAPRLQAPFDPPWFAELPAPTPAAAPPAAAAVEPAPLGLPAAPALSSRGWDWGEAPDVGAFHGRALELETLTRWVLAEGCRLLALFGMGGIGKTALAARLARELAPGFEVVYWRSLRNAPPPEEWLAGAILFLSAQQILPAEGEEARLRQLLELLRERRSLLVLDNLETVLEPGTSEVRYRPGCEGYGQVLQWLGEAGHASCLVLTSRELPPEVGPRAGAQAPVRVLPLGGVDTPTGRALLADRGLVGDAAAWESLVARYGGNALALQVVGETIRALFGGEIAAFLAQGEAVFGDIRRLLDAQLARLSPAERAVLDWLAVEREPVDFGTLVVDLGAAMPRRAAMEALEALGRRSLLEQGEQGATFTLQPVVLEYVTERLVEQLADEIARGEPARLVSHAVIKAQAKDYVRQSQERLIAASLFDRLEARGENTAATERGLLALLEEWRGRPAAAQSYGPGNAVNLLRLLRGDLRELDLSRLALRQTYLAVPAQDARLVGAHFSDSVLAEPMGAVVSTALSPDGSYLVAGTMEGAVRLWHVTDRRLIFAVERHSGPVWGVGLSADGRRVASGAGDGTVWVWDAASGERLHVLTGHTAAVLDVGLSADGRRVASGGADATVRVWDAASGECLHVLTGHTGEVRGVALSADGRHVASGGLDGTVRSWDAASGECLQVLTGHTSGVWRVALSADGRRVASGAGDGTVRVWDAASGERLHVLTGHTGEVRGAALSADGQWLASGGADATVRVWDLASGACLRVLTGHTAGIWDVALRSDGRLVVSAAMDGTIQVWDARSGECLRVVTGHTPPVWDVALSADGRRVASGGADAAVRLWDAASGECLRVLTGHAAVLGVGLSADGRRVASGAGDGTVRVWDAESGECLHALTGHTGEVRGAALSADGQWLASGGADAAVRVWDAASGACLRVLTGHTGEVRGAALSADGRRVASGAGDRTVRVWDAASGECLHVLTGHTAAVLDVGLSADGRRVASGAGDGTVRVWDAVSGECLHVLTGHTGEVRGVTLSADGRRVASGGLDGTVRLWDAASGACLQVLTGHTSGVWRVALSADGSLAVSAGLDGTVCLWDARTDARLRMLRPDRLYERMDVTGLTGVTAAQRAALLALGAVDRSVRATPA